MGEPQHAPSPTTSVSLAPLVRHELRQLLRDGRFWWIGAIVFALLLSSGIFGWSHASNLAAEREEAQQTAAAQWASQGEKNPHEAAHYGTYVFKPAGALAFVDPGVESSLGVTVKLQAHKRSALDGASAQDSTAIKHFGQLSPASILQLILPLLIIGLGFTVWSAERERGTLRQIMSYGVAPRQLLLGKVLGLSVALTLLMLPAVAVGAVGVMMLPGESELPVARAGMMAVVYGVYMAVYLLISVWVSAWAKSSRGALVILLGFWGVTSLIVPRLAGDAVDAVIPMPTAEAFANDVKTSMASGLPGGEGREEQVELILEALLKKEGFDGGMLMMDGSQLQGFELEAEAAYEREILDYHFERLEARSQAQEAALQATSIISPFIAIRTLSMGLAGTDLAHHQDFSAEAEAYRRALVSQLNTEFAKKGGSEGWAYKANRALWEKAPSFDYAPPEVGWALERQAMGLAALGLWLIVALIGAVVSARRVKVVV